MLMSMYADVYAIVNGFVCPLLSRITTNHITGVQLVMHIWGYWIYFYFICFVVYIHYVSC